MYGFSELPSQQLFYTLQTKSFHGLTIGSSPCLQILDIMVRFGRYTYTHTLFHILNRRFVLVVNPLSYLQSSLLFNGVAQEELQNFLQDCSFAEFRVGERMHIGARGSADVPISVVGEGCLAVHAPTEFGEYEPITLALIMPSQLLGEFEYLGGTLPDRLEVIAIDETKVLSFHGNSLKALIKTHPAIAQNLAKTILIKQHISNFRLEAVCQTKGRKKIATLLLGFIRIQEWKPAIYNDQQFKQEMPLSIMWSIELLSRYLSCDVRTARDGLLELMEAQLISLQGFDNALKPLDGVSAADIIDVGKKHYFRITITRPNKLEEYCAG